MSRPNTDHSTSRRAPSTAPSYRSISKTSYVDEDLFGTSHRPAPSGNRNPPASAGSNLSGFFMGETAQPTYNTTKKPKEESIQLITKDLIRTLKVPTNDGSDSTTTLSMSEYMRIKQNSSVRAKSASERRREELQKEREKAMMEAQARREEMKRLESKRAKNQPLSDLELEAQAKNEFLLKNAHLLMEEQEDEIKQLNEMILSAKCHAIRQAQIAEKQIIKAELAAEEARLDELMEIDRVRAIKSLEEREAALQEMRTGRAKEIKQQILERQQQRLIDNELKDQETQVMLAQLERMQQEDREAAQRKKERAQMLMTEASKFNELSIQLKKQQAELARLEDLKAVEFLKAKAEREEALVKEEERKKKERELELARLLALQEHALDQVAERHAIEAKRQSEAKERALRQKEKEDAVVKAKAIEHLQQARMEQIAVKTQYLASQAAHDRDEFERVLQAQKELIVAEEAKQKEEQARRNKHKQEVISQIRTKEAEKVEERKAFFEEGIKLDQEAKARQQHIEEIKLRKLAELQEAGVGDEYLHQIKRKIQGGRPKLGA